MKLKGSVAVILLVGLVGAVGLFAACGEARANPVSSTGVTGQAEIAKPKPVVVGINATTTGMFEDYYAILDVTVRNEGADGMIILISGINQANKNVTSELPTYLPRNVTQTVRMVLPLNWRSGDWTPSAVVEIP
jgi:hypothetical protein